MSQASLALGAALALVAAANAQQPYFSTTGSGAGARHGSAVAVLGDLDGDKQADLAVGEPDVGAGRVVVVSGRTGAVLRTHDGDSAGDAFGASVAHAGDVNGDGVADLIVGAPGDDDNGTDSGSARLISGTGAVLDTFRGDSAGDAFGSSVSGAGDVDRDGYSDVVAGAPGDDNNGTDSGSARLFSGKTRTAITTFDGAAAGDGYGGSVGGAFDANGDGFSDVVVGAPGNDANGANAGAAEVRSGASHGVLFTVRGLAADDALGRSVSRAGDTDGDGRGDIVVGVPGDDARGANAGAAWIVSGASGSTLRVLTGRAAGDLFGSAVAGGSDCNGDGRGDVVVGAPGAARHGDSTGAVHVFSGPTGHALRLLVGSQAGVELGAAVGAGSDLNGDGYGDFAAGAPGSAASAGAVHAFADRPAAGVEEVAHPMPSGLGSHFGWGIINIGDITDDNVDDYTIAAPFEGTSQEGSVRVYSGADHSFLKKIDGPLNGLQTGTSWFGHEVAPIGDIDQDGYPDFGIGAWHYDSMTGVQDIGRAELISGKTLTSMQVYLGPGFRSHMGSAIGSLGDVNGDQVDDYFIGMLLDDNEKGRLDIYSGATRLPIPGLTFKGLRNGDTLSQSAAAVGDLNGDGVCDIAIGASQATVQPVPGPGYVHVRSGANGTFLYEWGGMASRDLYGWEVASAGDVNADGMPDIIIGAYQTDQPGLLDCGMAEVRSGANGSVLYRFFGTAASESLGNYVDGAGDVDGDGYADFIISAPMASPGGVPAAGLLNVHSGFDGRALHTFAGAGPFFQLRFGNDLGDLNGDGLDDFAIGNNSSPNPGSAGQAWIYETKRGSDPGFFQIYGRACPGSAGALPHIQIAGRPIVGGSFTARLTTAPAGTLAILNIGGAESALPLAALHAPGCTLLTLAAITAPAATNPQGDAAIPLPVPANPAFVGASLYFQWAAVDLPANGLGVIFSDGARVVLGK